MLDDKSDIGHTHSQYVTSSTSSLYYYYTKTQVDQIESELRAAIDEAAAGGDVDLSNYYTKYQTDNLLNQKAALNHSHAISDITNLQSTLNGKASTNHSHSISDISNLQSQLNNKANSSHTHSISQISELQSQLDNINTKLDELSQGSGGGGLVTEAITFYIGSRSSKTIQFRSNKVFKSLSIYCNRAEGDTPATGTLRNESGSTGSQLTIFKDDSRGDSTDALLRVTPGYGSMTIENRAGSGYYVIAVVSYE